MGQLLVDPGQLFGHLIRGGLRRQGGAQQLADGDLQYLGQADQQGGVRDGQAAFP